MKSRVWTSILSLALVSGSPALAQTDGPQAPLPTVLVEAPRAELKVEVANTFEERERGLMFRTALPPHTGMLFVFPSEAPSIDFWMKNTVIPLDMVFVDRRGIVTHVAADVPATTPSTPDARIPRRGGRAKFVFELPAGEAASDGLAPGAAVRIPSVSAKE